ncbi:uncharacterized protein [Centruroides vittatus]|uniref:uncharacterized protein n=1 Tax=Centruroides vittatus TaxID=120091 RepID=UPI00350EE888
MAESLAKRMRKQVDLELFIEEVRKYRCLYDKKCREFKDIGLKHTIWTAIGVKFGLNGSEAEQKWKVQRDRYNRERKKIRESLASGSGTRDIYKTTWHLYDLMDSVLRDCISECASSVNNMSPLREISNLIHEDENSLENNIEIVSCMSLTQSNNEDIPMSETQMQNISPTENPDVFNTPSLSKSNFEKSRKEKGILNDLEETTKNISEYFLKKAKQEKQPDLVSRFCEYLDARLRNLNPRNRREAIHGIELLMQEKEKADNDF